MKTYDLTITAHSANFSYEKGERFSINWKDETARYHIWVSGGEIQNTIYKNSPLDVDSSDPEFFRTKELNLNAKKYKSLRDQISAIPESEYEAAFEKYKQEQREIEEKEACDYKQRQLAKLRELASEYGYKLTKIV